MINNAIKINRYFSTGPLSPFNDQSSIPYGGGEWGAEEVEQQQRQKKGAEGGIIMRQSTLGLYNMLLQHCKMPSPPWT